MITLPIWLLALVTVLAVLLIIFLTSTITRYMHIKKAQTTGCPFKNACTVYHDYETREAMRRVSKLLLDNIQEDTEYKKALRVFLQNDKLPDYLINRSSE